MEKQLSSENNQLSSEEILGLLPHRFPFALVDRVIDHVPGQKAVALKNVTIIPPTWAIDSTIRTPGINGLLGK